MASDLGVQAQLITAIFDLQVVRGIRNAIRVNLLKKGGREGLLGNIENPKPPPSLPNFGEQHHPGATERPTTIGAEVRPRPVDASCGCDYRAAYRSTDIAPLAPLPDFTPRDLTLPASDAERAIGVPARHESPLAPPWRQPLPQSPQVAILVVKYDACRPDQNGKGKMLDLFI